MWRSIYSFFAVAIACFSAQLGALSDVKDPSTGESFPAEITFNEGEKTFKLDLTGISTRKKLIVKIYSVASYIENAKSLTGPNKIQQLMDSKAAKQLTLKWVRAVDAAKVVEGYHESFKGVMAANSSPELQQQVEQYIALFNHDVAKGEEQVLRWFPDGRVVVLINGKQTGEITGEAFAKTLWSIWFGKKSVVNAEQLVSGTFQ
jgi:hypothetical protein